MHRRNLLKALGAAPAVRNLRAAQPAPAPPALLPFLTRDADFYELSRGTPKPHTLSGEAQAAARLTPATWRCEITADPFVEEPHTKVPAKIEKPLTLAGGDALDLEMLESLGRRHAVHFIHAIQCLNMEAPLGQGIWTGVPLREVLALCGRIENVRRIWFWGYHNNDPKQVFQSSVSYTQCMETPPDSLPVMLAWRMNGEPLSAVRGGPVRMIGPGSHAYMSIKWLQHIFLTNDPRVNDTYALNNNDPDSFLKTAAYLDRTLDKRQFKPGEPVIVTGQVISGPSGLARVEAWLRRIEGTPAPLPDDAPELRQGPWLPCALQPQPDWNKALPPGIDPRQVLGFDRKTGKPLAWPPRYARCAFSVVLRDLRPGAYEVRARSVDLNGFAQPEPRPALKNGRNAIQVRRFEVA
jgi:DMSO/TMAO reductase YedYZ molybdopterin-dependent catalytic subunit